MFVYKKFIIAHSFFSSNAIHFMPKITQTATRTWAAVEEVESREEEKNSWSRTINFYINTTCDWQYYNITQQNGE